MEFAKFVLADATAHCVVPKQLVDKKQLADNAINNFPVNGFTSCLKTLDVGYN
jgi:hypothetical protein